MIKKIFQKIPKLPLSALVFYLSVLLLWQLGLIPSPGNILLFLENLYESYGLTGLFFASFLESIVYLGLYFPGSFIIALAVVLSDGTFQSLFTISLIVALTLTMTSIINYVLGRVVAMKKLKEEESLEKKLIFSKGLFISMLHPNALAFYFFNSGIEKQNFMKIAAVPLFMIPYGLALAYLFYSIREPLKNTIESPFIMITIILAWLLIAYLTKEKKDKEEIT